MFHTISERIIKYAVNSGALKGTKAEEYIYGLEISLSVLVNYASILVIGLLMGMLWQSALFLFLYTSIRRFAGGFHFNSQIVCYLSMCILCALILFVIKYGENSAIWYFIIMGVSVPILLMIVPVPAITKPLDAKETIVYGRIARMMIITVTIIAIVLYFCHQIYLVKIIAVTIFAVTIFAVLGKIKYKLYKC